MPGDNERSRLFTRRAFLIGGLQAGLLTMLGGRIYYLEIVEGEKYRTLAEENRISLRLLTPRRGQILDRNRTPLALNQQNFRIVLLPGQVDDLGELLNELAQYIDITDNDRKRIARDVKNSGILDVVLVKDNLTRDQMDAVAVHSLELSGTSVDVGEVRSYPYGAATSHILGYVGNVSKREMNPDGDEDSLLSVPGFRIGKNGVEKQYDTALRGGAGNVQLEVNAHGSIVRELTRNDPNPGDDLVLGIDVGLQQYIQQRLAREQGGAAVIVDVDSGEIRALVSQPGFDPNLFTYGISQEDWDRLSADENAPLLNKAISGVYAPGSTFKPVVAMAALEADIVDPDARVFCPGYYEIGTYRFYCWKHGGHGNVDLRQAMAQSCDTYFYDLGFRTGIDRIQAMAQRFGLGQKTGIDLPHERAGFVPGRAWKSSTQGQGWQQGETLVAAIGQGYILTTPLQLAVMAARLANGGKAIQPHLARTIGGRAVENIGWPSLGFVPAHLELIQDSLSAVVNETIGTAYSSRISEKGLEMAGKTGTAQVRHISKTEREGGVTANDDLPWKERDHALFIGYAPTDTPRFAVAVVVEHGGSGSHAAAPIARDILQECLMRTPETAVGKSQPRKT